MNALGWILLSPLGIILLFLARNLWLKKYPCQIKPSNASGVANLANEQRYDLVLVRVDRCGNPITSSHAKILSGVSKSQVLQEVTREHTAADDSTNRSVMAKIRELASQNSSSNRLVEVRRCKEYILLVGFAED